MVQRVRAHKRRGRPVRAYQRRGESARYPPGTRFESLGRRITRREFMESGGVAFTPERGDEFVDPIAAERRLQKARADGEELELSDILEEITPGNAKDVAAENVAYVLKRDGMLPEGWSVVIPEGAYDYDLGDDGGFFSGGWELFAPDGMTVGASGRVDGSVSAGELLDVNVTVETVTGPQAFGRRYG